jgi:hypothetical protein
MQRPWSDLGPLPFLRITRSNGAFRAQMFLYWKPDRMHPRNRPTGSDVVCREGVCVRPIGLEEHLDWGEVAQSLAFDACRQDPLPPVVVDAEHAWIKTKADNVYREQSCNVPAPESPAGTLLRLMKAAAIESRRQ